MMLINGQPQTHISVMDRGFQYGDGLFETIAVKNGNLELWPLHWARLSDGCQRLNIPVPAENLILDEIRQVQADQESAVIKLILTRGESGRGYFFSDGLPTRVVMCNPWPAYNELNIHGIDLFVCDTRIAIQPQLAGIKHLNRLENVLARNEWRDERFAEGIMRSTEDDIIEGTMSNIFLVKHQKLFTPDLKRCGVQGVMRQHIINLAAKAGIETDIKLITMDDVNSADEMFVCNSLIGIWPVNHIANKTFNAPKELTRKLQLLIEQE